MCIAKGKSRRFRSLIWGEEREGETRNDLLCSCSSLFLLLLCVLLAWCLVDKLAGWLAEIAKLSRECSLALSTLAIGLGLVIWKESEITA